MKRVQSWVLLGTLVGLSLVGGCATQNGLALSKAAPCDGGKWMSARRGPTGAWMPGHWSCPSAQN